MTNLPPSPIPPAANPLPLFAEWFADAQQSEPNDPGAMTLATVNNGQPEARIVLLRSYNEQGFGFFTNRLSRKGQALAHNPNVALCLHWKSLLRQIRIEGVAHEAPGGISDDYFNKRHRSSRVGAWASLQSQKLDSMQTLAARMEEFDEEYKDGNVPRPPHWGGYIVQPTLIEFWQQRDYRLHERIQYVKNTDGWGIERLYP